MTTAYIHTNNEIILNGVRSIGRIFTVCKNGQIKPSAPTKNSTSVLIPNGISMQDAIDMGMANYFDVPVYTSKSPSSHYINQDLIDALAEI